MVSWYIIQWLQIDVKKFVCYKRNFLRIFKPFAFPSWFRETWINYSDRPLRNWPSIPSSATLFSREETTYSIATVTYTRPFGPSPREIIHRDLSLSPRVFQSTSLRGGGIGENHEKHECENESENIRCAREQAREERSFSSFSSSFSLSGLNLANVLVAREVASVSVDLHLVQRAESLFGDRLSGDRSRAAWQIAVCQVLAFVFPFFFFFSLLSFPKADVTRSILVRTRACELEL